DFLAGGELETNVARWRAAGPRHGGAERYIARIASRAAGDRERGGRRADGAGGLRSECHAAERRVRIGRLGSGHTIGWRRAVGGAAGDFDDAVAADRRRGAVNDRCAGNAPVNSQAKQARVRAGRPDGGPAAARVDVGPAAREDLEELQDAAAGVGPAVRDEDGVAIRANGELVGSGERRAGREARKDGG